MSHGLVKHFTLILFVFLDTSYTITYAMINVPSSRRNADRTFSVHTTFLSGGQPNNQTNNNKNEPAVRFSKYVPLFSVVAISFFYSVMKLSLSVSGYCIMPQIRCIKLQTFKCEPNRRGISWSPPCSPATPTPSSPRMWDGWPHTLTATPALTWLQCAQTPRWGPFALSPPP